MPRPLLRGFLSHLRYLAGSGVNHMATGSALAAVSAIADDAAKAGKGS